MQQIKMATPLLNEFHSHPHKNWFTSFTFYVNVKTQHDRNKFLLQIHYIVRIFFFRILLLHLKITNGVVRIAVCKTLLLQPLNFCGYTTYTMGILREKANVYKRSLREKMYVSSMEVSIASISIPFK